MENKVPGPGDYEIKSCFSTPKKEGVKSVLGGKWERKTHLDEIIRSAKKTPGPGYFNPRYNNRVVGNVKIKGERGTFLDEWEYIGLTLPSPGSYSFDLKAISKHTSTPMYKKPLKNKEDWKPK